MIELSGEKSALKRGMDYLNRLNVNIQSLAQD
ncbi:unnamed protein product, partial [marine sediment metagenome]